MDRYLYKPLLLTLILGLMVVFGIQVGLKNLTDPGRSPGCPASVSDGSLDLSQTVAVWQNRTLHSPLAMSDTLSDKEKQVLGISSEEKWIEVDLKNQKLIARQGNTVFLESLISSGLWNKTPPGQYRIWYKIKYTKMEGGSRLNNTYYYLPNVPYAMFFYGDYGIHGTYWHKNFGHRMSHGCVNSPTPIAEKLFYWTDPQLPAGKNIVRSTPENPGTRVIIHD